VARDLTSFVHDHLVGLGEMASFDNNRPRAVRCVHPLVTLLEKLDAIQRRFPKATADPATFVRHFEDAARIIDAAPLLPALHGYASPLSLAEDMLAQRQVAARATAADPAFTPLPSSRGLVGSDQAMPVGEEVRIWTETLMSRPVGASPTQPKRSQQAGSQTCSCIREGAVDA